MLGRFLGTKGGADPDEPTRASSEEGALQNGPKGEFVTRRGGEDVIVSDEGRICRPEKILPPSAQAVFLW